MAKVLLLNASYEPLRIVSVKRAIVMLVEEKAITEVEGDGEYRSPSTSIKVPAVIRLTRYVKVPYKANKPLTNRAVLARDNYECAYCESRKADTIDHVKPRSRGGAHEWTNVVSACRKCNFAKADKTLKELGWTLRYRPFVPKGTYWLVIGLAESDVREEWRPFMDVAFT